MNTQLINNSRVGDRPFDEIKEGEITQFTGNKKDFIHDDEIQSLLKKSWNADTQEVRDIIQKSLSIKRLEPEETAALLNVKDNNLWEEIFFAAAEIKRRVYDNRIVTFAPLYLSNFCTNSCVYCSFRKENVQEKRRRLTGDEIRKETEAILSVGHKRVIVVYGEHPLSNIDYIADTIKTIYDTKAGTSTIRRINVNSAPMSVDDLKILKQTGIGTYQVFQETYHHRTYREVHPSGKKSNYQWRLYALHRAMEAGIDDVAIGALFGLYDWKFEVMGLLYHAIELERNFGVGPHTISFPRVKSAANTPLGENPAYNNARVSDEDFKKLVAVIRLSVPYTGMILTAREPAHLRKEVLSLGVTQMDASTRIGIGSYSENYNKQEMKRQQFLIGDTRSLEELIGELAGAGHITSFCTAGYRCGRTGKCIMDMLSRGKERWFCKINAVLTYREWLDDFADNETKRLGEEVIKKEISEIKESVPALYPKCIEYYERIKNGERDLFI